MCYNQPMSLSFALLGILAWVHSKNRENRVIILFYSCMEILQTVQYNFVDECQSNINMILTLIAHVLVCVQPCLWNWYRIRTNGREYRQVFTAFFGQVVRL